MEKKLDLILQKLEVLDDGMQQLNKRVGSIEFELKDFRGETKTMLQVIQTGQQGTREEITQRFNETKKGLERLEADVEFTYQKTALHDLKFNRIKNNPDEKQQ